MTSSSRQKIYLKDYKKPDFSIQNLDLFFDLHEDYALVKSNMKVDKVSPSSPLVLDGEGLELIDISINGKALGPSEYIVTEKDLTIAVVPDHFVLEITVKNKPQLNTKLEGLYKSNGIFCTQCEAQGFRHITYFMDRPDVMTKYTVTIEADQKKYPVLLSNGDRVEQKIVAGGRHQVKWNDPFKKPCYLFALVAGDLGVMKDRFVTMNGKKVDLEIYAAHGVQSRCLHAMDSLKKAMKWDEDRFGREYDLSTFMIVAIDDFNMGAMENKGLNIFNSRLVLADAKTATDSDYYNIESVVGHEYFHNWTGNRVTLRDWFHLSLKEGLTVFRDQEFSMDLHSRAMIRIDNVTDLRNVQFSEDSGPNSHPIRPESCYAVDNFYTPTIYEKGAEVIRMMQTMVGRPGFRKGMDLYFERHDGHAVIIEDFAKAIADANNQNWEQFKLWYSQAGTPTVKVTENYLASEKKYELTLEQSCPPSKEQKTKLPFHIPLVIGLLGADGKDLKLNCPDIVKNTEGQILIHLKQPLQKFVFTDVTEKPVLSLNRSFSAPIHLDWKASTSQLLFLMQNDSDEFNRVDGGQKLAVNAFSGLIATAKGGGKLQAPEQLISGYGRALKDPQLTENMKATLLSLPDDSYLSQLEPVFDAMAFLQARECIEQAIGSTFQTELISIYHKYNGKNEHGLTPQDFANRRLKNLDLSYLSHSSEGAKLAYEQFKNAKIMTDEAYALVILSHLNSDYRKQAIQQFHDHWKDESLVLNKWFAIQASSSHPDTFDTVVALWNHPDFNFKNPNRVYSLLSRFGDNFVRFNDPNKDTYTFMADKIIEIDRINPQVASRLASSFDIWPKLIPSQKDKVRNQLDRLLNANLSKNTFEIISRAAKADIE